MKNLIKHHSPRKHAKSFRYAFEGIFHALANEPNFRIHIVATIAVVTLGVFFDISNIEWTVIILISAMVLTAEMMNTVVEQVIDYLFKEKHPVAKITKDLAAGYVLIFALAALLIFTLIFGYRLKSFYYQMTNTSIVRNYDSLSRIKFKSEKRNTRSSNGFMQ